MAKRESKPLVDGQTISVSLLSKNNMGWHSTKGTGQEQLPDYGTVT
jgi:hypothetical protein